MSRGYTLDSEHFRLKLSQFLFASFNKTGYKLCKSKDLDAKISEGSMIHLCRQGGKRDEQTFIHSFLPNEKILAISCITPALDSIGRPTSQNHTILIDTRNLEELVKPYLTAEVPLMPPKHLEEILLEVNPTNV